MSTIWFLKKGAVTQSLADWGITTESVSLAFNSLDPDHFSFAVEESDVLADPTFAYGDLVTLYKDTTPWFIGTIRQIPAAGSAQSETNRYIAYNIWWELDHLVYEQSRYFVDVTFATLTGIDTTQVVLGQDNYGTKITTAAQIDALIAFAVTAGVSFTGATSFTGVIPPYEEARDISVANAIKRMCSWTPDLVCRVVYSSGAPVLTFLRRSDATTYTFDLLGVSNLLSWQISARNDLVPAGVVFKFLGGIINPSDGNRYTNVTTQTAGTTSGVGVIKSSISLAGVGGDNPEAVPAGLAAAYYGALSTVFYEGELRLKAQEVGGDIRPGHRINFSNGRTAWATAQALVQSVTEIPYDGETIVSFGIPSFLSLADLMALNKRLNQVIMGNRSGLSQIRTADGLAGDPSNHAVTPSLPTTDPSAGGYVEGKAVAGQDPLGIVAGNGISAGQMARALTRGGNAVPPLFLFVFPQRTLDLCDGSTITVLKPS
jgi:hypothetical protein